MSNHQVHQEFHLEKKTDALVMIELDNYGSYHVFHVLFNSQQTGTDCSTIPIIKKYT